MISGGDGNDTLYGDNGFALGDALLQGGRDVLSGGAGTDLLLGGIDADTMTGGSGADTFRFVTYQDSTIRSSASWGLPPGSGETGVDTITDYNPVEGDKLDFTGFAPITLVPAYDPARDAWLTTNGASESPQMTLTYDAATNSTRLDIFTGGPTALFTLNMQGQHTTADGMVNVTTFVPPVTPTEGDDQFVGTNGNDTIDLLGGNDTYDGLGGDDTIFGGAGHDTLFGGDGHDFLSGGDGNDTLIGGEGTDNFDGGEGDDIINGGNGNDALNANGGNDTLNGGDGNDRLVGFDGADTLSGGSGADWFNYGSHTHSTLDSPDTITDFNGAEGDQIAVWMLDSDSNVPDTQDWYFVGTERRSDLTDKGQIVVQQNGDGWKVLFYQVGSTTAASAINVNGSAPSAGDFFGAVAAPPPVESTPAVVSSSTDVLTSFNGSNDDYYLHSNVIGTGFDTANDSGGSNSMWLF